MGSEQSSPAEEGVNLREGAEENPQTEHPKSLNPDQTKDDDESAEDYFHDCQDSDDNGDENAVKVNEDEDTEDEGEEENPLYTRLVRRPCCGCCLTRFPRTMAIIIGIVLPLFALIVISLGFGYILADYEAPSEYSANDEVIANYHIANLQAEVVVNVTLILPRACFLLYLQIQDSNATDVPPLLPILEGELLESFINNEGGIFGPDQDLLIPEEYHPSNLPSQGNITFDNSTDWFEERYGHLFVPEDQDINVTDLYNFMNECSLSAEDTVRDLLSRAMTNVSC